MAADTSFLRNTNAGINEQLMTAQQQLAYAQALRGQSLQPIQAPGGQNGRISPLAALAQALNGYDAKGMMQGATHDLATAQAAQSNNYMAAVAKMLNPDQDQPPAPPPAASTAPAAGATAPAQDPGPVLSSTPQASMPGAGAPSAAAGPSTGPASAPAPAPAGAAPFAVQDPRSDPKYRQMAMAEQLGVLPQGSAAAYAKAKYDYGAPTDQIKNDSWAGVTPQQRSTITNSFTLSPNQTRGQIGSDGKPSAAMVGADPENNRQYSVAPNGTVTASGVKGAPEATAKMAGAKAKAAADEGIIMVTLPSGEVVPMRAGPAAVAGGVQAGITAPPTWGGGQLDPVRLQRLRDGAAQGDPDAKAALAAYQQAQPRLGADPTVQTARNNQQNALAEKWKPLNEAVSNAQTINSRLDTIKDLATRASTGQFADRMQFANSLLSMAGSEKATDAATAKALLDKNASQIVAQLGQGGLGTDAARSIISSAYPNAHMPAPAIAEAVDNLKAANSMTVAKAGVLQQHYLKNDPAAYQQAESQFNAVADPRIFQWHAMPAGEAKNAYARRLIQQDPSMAGRVDALEKMGAFK